MRYKTLITFCIPVLLSATTFDLCNSTILSHISLLQSLLQEVDGKLGSTTRACDVVWMTENYRVPLEYLVHRPTTFVDARFISFYCTRAWKIRSFCRMILHDGIDISERKVKGKFYGITYHLIFAKDIKDLNIKHIRLLGDVLIVSQGNNVYFPGRPKLYTLSPSGSSFLELDAPHYPTKKDFQGAKLIWVTTKQRHGPFDLLLQYRESREWLDDRFSMVLAITKALNATPSVDECKDHMGIDKDTGRVTGMIGVLQDGEGHISFFHMSLDIHEEILLGSYMTTDGIAFVSRLPLPKELPGAIRSVYGLFDMEGWLATLAVMVIITLIISWGSDMEFGGLIKMLPQLVKPVGGQPFCNEFLRFASRPSAEIVLSLWLLLSILLNSEIQTQLTTSMTIPRMDEPPRTFEELLRSDYNVMLSLSQGTILGKLFHNAMANSDGGIFPAIRSKIVKEFTTFDEKANCYQETQSRPVVCLGQLKWGIYFSHLNLVNGNGKILYQESDLIFPSFVVFGFNKGLPHIVGATNLVVSNFVQSGVLVHIEEWVVTGKTNEGRMKAKERNKNGKQYPLESASIEVRINGSELLLANAILCMSAGATFILEVIIHHCRGETSILKRLRGKKGSNVP